MTKLALFAAVLVVALSLIGGAGARGKGSQEWSISLVSTTPGSPYGMGVYSITRLKPPIRFNLVYRAHMWTRCVDSTGFTWDVSGEVKWIYSEAASTPIRAQYFGGMACSAWAYNSGDDHNDPDSNVVTFTAP